ncbi:hypothetical protein D3C84_907480 [compost metagenome]
MEEAMYEFTLAAPVRQAVFDPGWLPGRHDHENMPPTGAARTDGVHPGRRTRAVAMPRHHSRCDDYPCAQRYLEQRDLGSVEASRGAIWITAMANSLR